MYAWLIDEVSLVKTNKFFVFHKDADPTTLKELEHSFAPLPQDYVAFVLEFGRSNLFRDLKSPGYKMVVMSRPRLKEDDKGNQWLEIGFYLNAGMAYLKKKSSAEKIEKGIYEGMGIYETRKITDSFGEWLIKRFGTAKKLYKKKEWKEIIAGPKPFTEEELKIVSAIPLFNFEKVGVAENGDLRIRVQNNSNIRLQYLTIGVLVPNRLNGGIRLPVGEVGPGETKIVEQDAYKDIVPAETVELYRRPLPEPEDRRMYYEFKT